MSRSRNKKRKQSKEKRQQELSQAFKQEQKRGLGDEDVVRDTAAVYTCLYEIASDYAQQCQVAQENFEDDIVFTALACRIWQDRPGQAEQLTGALTDFLAARRRYFEAVTTLEPRFRALLDPPVHEHLDPIEHYRDMTHRHLFPHEFDPPHPD